MTERACPPSVRQQSGAPGAPLPRFSTIGIAVAPEVVFTLRMNPDTDPPSQVSADGGGA